MVGFLAEMQAHGSGMLAPRLASGGNWLILAGAHDPLYDFGDHAEYWREILPGVGVQIVADGGRWLHLTHVDQVVAALDTIGSDRSLLER